MREYFLQRCPDNLSIVHLNLAEFYQDSSYKNIPS